MMSKRTNLYTLREFLARNRLNRKQFDGLCAAKGSPRMIKVGDQFLISRGAEWAWVNQLESQAVFAPNGRRKVRRR